MPVQLPVYVRLIAAFILAVGLSLYAVKKIIFVTSHRRIFDIPDNIRKIHGAQIPSLGGIGIFTGYMAAAAFFMDRHWYVVMAAAALLFFTGIYDDIMNMRPSKKLATQLLASCIAVFLADVRIRSLYGLAGIQELPYAISAAITIIACTFFINVFNFMDGIDGLASTLAIFYTVVPGLLLANVGQYGLAGIAFSLAGAAAGLLWYNVAPARIYMGDTGSMFVGFTIFVFTLAVPDAYATDSVRQFPLFNTPLQAFILMFSMICIPVLDALRVFALRIASGTSPLHADRSHIHYYLLDAGLGHSAAVTVIVGLNSLLLATAWLMRSAPAILTLAVISAITLVFLVALSRIRRKARHQSAGA